MQIVTAEQLVKVLLDHPSRGAKLCAIVTRTRPKLLKKSRATGEPCPFPDGVERTALRQVTLGSSYQKAVNRQRVHEAEAETGRRGDGEIEKFQAEPLWNGKGEWDTRYTVRHTSTGRRYLAVRPAQVESDTEAGSVAVVVRDQWNDVATGRLLDVEADRLEEFLPAQSKSQTQDVEHDVQWRTIALDSIVELRYGEVYQVKHE